MEQGSNPPPATAAADPDRLRPPLAAAAPPSSPTGGVGCSKGSAIGGLGLALPDEIIAEILSRLPAKPLFRFKCVSKSWFALTTYIIKKLPQTLQGFFYGDNSGENYGHFINLVGRSMPPVDCAFSFLTKLPEIEKINLLGSCNGLILLRHIPYVDPNNVKALGYIVCNPAIKEWVAVPNSGWTLPPYPEELFNAEDVLTLTYLFFDPAVSSQFKVLQFCQDFPRNVLQVNTYSSESGVWSGRVVECWTHEVIRSYMGSAFVNGMVHWSIDRCLAYPRDAIVAVDGEGEKCRIIHWPEEERGSLVFLGQSQGLMHCMSGHMDHYNISELSIWVLDDYDAENWILKHSVSCLQLFGQASCHVRDFQIAIHPDHNLVFFVQHWNMKLISYNLDSEELSVLWTLEHCSGFITPYIPYFVESSSLAKKS
ncbi:unnamed protein product [Urochloa decumbens]|uniref:F-box domain-containing protein n=1 Tax=Urochloa decumbens TaxID=240449 RepID=A0ABC9FNN8_9POAL